MSFTENEPIQLQGIELMQTASPLREHESEDRSMSIGAILNERRSEEAILNDRELWRRRNFLTDVTQTWLNKFVAFTQTVDQVTPAHLMFLAPHEESKQLFDAVKKQNKTFAAASALSTDSKKISFLFKKEAFRAVIKSLTRRGIVIYGFQLIILETSTVASIWMIKLIIDYLKTPSDYNIQYAIGIFSAFTILRLISLLARNYYDCHVYNYFRFVQTQIQCWLFELTCDLRQWQIREEKQAQLVNILTKDIDVFVNGSWCFPYLVTVPLNTLASACLLSYMYGPKVLVCYGAIAALLLVQYCSNKRLASLQQRQLAFSDKRIEFIAQVIKSIRHIKCEVLEKLFSQRTDEVRRQELKVYSTYCDLKNVCASIYLNAGVLISSLVFMTADRDQLDLGKVFSTLALLGYIFNFSILYANYAIEALYSLKVFMNRVELVITEPYEQSHGQGSQNDHYAVKSPSEEEGPLLVSENVCTTWQEAADDSELITGEEIPSDDESHLLSNINFSFKKNDKVAVVGRTGIGKSSLLMVILEEMPIKKGQFTFYCKKKEAKIVLSEQDPLVVTGTIQQNILFGLKMDVEWYERVLWACCLDEDLLEMPCRDQTRLGEMGQTLSGGQKTRLSLARALYHSKNAQVVLLDGTLSSLDSKISKLVFQRAIKDLCQEKLVFLVTYDQHQAAMMDYVLLLKRCEGRFTTNEVLTSRDFCARENQLQEVFEKQTETKAEVESGSVFSEGSQVIEDEHICRGSVHWKDFKRFFDFAFGGLFSVALILVLHLSINFCSIALSLYLAFYLTEMMTEVSFIGERYVQTLGIIVSAALVTAFFGKIISNRVFMSINRRLHNKMVEGLLRTKMDFFTENPTGRILNRFSKDVGTLDHMVFTFLEMTDYAIKVLYSLTMISVMAPYLVLVMLVSLIYLVRLRRKCLLATRDPIRLKYALMSPVNSLVQDAVNGLASIRCLQQQSFFMERLFETSDLQMRAHITSNGGNRWTAVRTDFQAFLVISSFAALALFAINPKSGKELALVAVGLQLAIEVTRNIDMALRWSVNIETDMLAIQRLFEYIDLTEETKNVGGQDISLEGRIQFQQVEMRYKADQPPALQNLSLEIQPGEHVAVVGRSGAGKSSLFQLLLGFKRADKGCVLIDNKDISQVCLESLRKEITVVHQQPFTIASDTLRANLDPQNLLSDYQLETVLNDASFSRKKQPAAEQSKEHSYRGLVDTLQDERGLELDSPASDLSIGQLQLLSLARAMLSQNKVVLLDEPTAQVDYQSQQTVLTNLFRQAKNRNATVLMIAHRLESAVAFAEKVVVMDKGHVAEFDYAFKLLARNDDDTGITETTIFADMVRACLPEQQRRIFLKAKEKYFS